MIQEVSFKNFKALRDVTVPLAPFTVIVGPNASGKTSVLEGLHYLTEVGSKPLAYVFAADGLDPDRLHTTGTPGEMTLSMRGIWDGVAGELAVSYAWDDSSRESYRYNMQGTWDAQPAQFKFESHRDIDPTYAVSTAEQPLLKAVRSGVFLHLDPTKLRYNRMLWMV